MIKRQEERCMRNGAKISNKHIDQTWQYADHRNYVPGGYSTAVKKFRDGTVLKVVAEEQTDGIVKGVTVFNQADTTVVVATLPVRSPSGELLAVTTAEYPDIQYGYPSFDMINLCQATYVPKKSDTPGMSAQQKTDGFRHLAQVTTLKEAGIVVPFEYISNVKDHGECESHSRRGKELVSVEVLAKPTFQLVERTLDRELETELLTSKRYCPANPLTMNRSYWEEMILPNRGAKVWLMVAGSQSDTALYESCLKYAQAINSDSKNCDPTTLPVIIQRAQYNNRLNNPRRRTKTAELGPWQNGGFAAAGLLPFGRLGDIDPQGGNDELFERIAGKGITRSHCPVGFNPEGLLILKNYARSQEPEPELEPEPEPEPKLEPEPEHEL
jgi:hypothetical protein